MTCPKRGDSIIIICRAVSLVWYTYLSFTLWCGLKTDTEYLINQNDCGSAHFHLYIRHEMLQVSFHPLIFGTYFVQLRTFRNIKKTIGCKREAEWHPGSFAEDGEDIFTCCTRNGQKHSRHSSDPTRGLRLFLLIIFIKLWSVIWSSVLYAGWGDGVQEEELLQRLAPPEPSMSSALRRNGFGV